MQAIIDAIKTQKLDAEICVVVSSNDSAYGLERARANGIPAFVRAKSSFKSLNERDESILELLKPYNVDYIVLAGYLGVLTENLVNAYPDKIINIHPALLPKFGGKGMYGINVHKAVIAAKENTSGATVHYVDLGTDTGKIILQESLEVLPDDTPESLQARILENIEHKLLVKALIKLEKEKSKRTIKL
ncbi:phosphoribosylglycinamide formyltransferase [Holotrichia oblita]|nr:phosphoribosylglycinamide formyltransferase [Holotrichia oblita]